MRELLVTHDDLDGAGCRVIYEVAHENFKKGVDYSVVNVAIPDIQQAINDRLMDGTIVPNETFITFADLCPKEETLLDLQDKGINFVVYDHHSTATWANEKFPEDCNVIVADEDGVLEAGTSLLFKAISIRYPLASKFAECVRYYDTYLWKNLGLLEPKQMQTLFYLLGMDRFCNMYVERIINSSEGTDLFDHTHMAFISARLEAEQKSIDTFITESKVYEFVIEPEGYRCAMTIGGSGVNISELANQWLIAHPEFDCFAIYLPNYPSISFRSVKDDVNVAQLCKRLGGGGHPKAAGVSLSTDTTTHVYEYVASLINEREE